jgi:hypothetical protein
MCLHCRGLCCSWSCLHHSTPVPKLHLTCPDTVAYADPIEVSTQQGPVPEIIDPVFAKTSQNAHFLLSENERFRLVFVKTGSINSGTELQMDVSTLERPVLLLEVSTLQHSGLSCTWTRLDEGHQSVAYTIQLLD